MAKESPATTYQMVFPSDAVSFDPDKFDELIRTQGVEMEHFRAVPCVVGMIDADDERRPHEHHEHCSNGYVYVKAGHVTCGFLGNSKEVKTSDLGRADGSTVQVIFPRYYDCTDNTKPVQPAPFDRIYLKDKDVAPVVTWEKHNCSDTGIEKLRYPAIDVTDLHDSTGKRYAQCEDFDIVEGNIVWRQGRDPGIDPSTKKGRVIGVRYTYRPFWYVQRMIHEVRVAQVENEFTGDRETIRFPQSMILQREYVFENEQRDRKIQETARTVKAPNDRGYIPSPDDLGVD